MFKNLKAEMAREGLSRKDIAIAIGISHKSFCNKLAGKSDFTRSEMLKIKEYFFKNHTLEYLFDSSDKKSA